MKTAIKSTVKFDFETFLKESLLQKTFLKESLKEKTFLKENSKLQRVFGTVVNFSLRKVFSFKLSLRKVFCNKLSLRKVSKSNFTVDFIAVFIF